MRDLTINEMHSIAAGTDLGTGASGIFSATNIRAASRLAGGLGLLYASWEVGWGIGTWIYNRMNYR